MDFETLLKEHQAPVERFVRFRISSRADAEDVLQEVYLAAFRQFASLQYEEKFKAWLIGIARNKCSDYFRNKAKLAEIPLEEIGEHALFGGSCGISESSAAEETLRQLDGKEQQILYLYYWEGLPQADIAARLKIPLGTVKSRLHTAKQKFREQYPYPMGIAKGGTDMKKLPDILPQYTIQKSEQPPFAVRHEELAGMLIIPRKGEKLSFGMYDFPGVRQTGMYQLEVTGEVVIHGIRGVEISSLYIGDDHTQEKSTIFAQLTDTHCRYLGGISTGSDGVQRVTTFLDGEAFSEGYEIGEDNCGFEVNRQPKGRIRLSGDGLVTDETGDVSDIVGRYEVTIGGKRYDTVKLVDMEESKNSYLMCEYYLDKSGRTILWRRFNRDDWAIERYGKKWTEQLPDNERLTINGETYVHWYDCITDYIL